MIDRVADYPVNRARQGVSAQVCRMGIDCLSEISKKWTSDVRLSKLVSAFVRVSSLPANVLQQFVSKLQEESGFSNQKVLG